MVAAEIIIAIVSLILGTAISEVQMQSQEKRNARETYVRSLYQAVQDRFNITMSQLDQLAERMGFNLTQMAESARGSARLSSATSRYLKYLKDYPQRVNQINKVKNEISNQINNLESQKSAAAAKIQQRQDVSNQQILQDVTQSIAKVKQADQGSESLIDTQLHEKAVTSQITEQPATQSRPSRQMARNARRRVASRPHLPSNS